MKKSFILAIVFIIMSSLALASEYEVKGKAEDYNIDVRFDKNPPDRGYNNIDVVITDKTSKPVNDAQVDIEYLMPSFYPGKAPMMKYDTTAKLSDHHYLARIDLSMAGEWTVILKVTRAGKTETMQFTFVVH